MSAVDTYTGDPYFLCASCGDIFDLPVWECPHCHHHLSEELLPDWCKYCYTPREVAS